MKRHVPVQGHRGIYYSEHANGTRVYECRYRDSDGRMRFEVVGPKLQQALDRARAVIAAAAREEETA